MPKIYVAGHVPFFHFLFFLSFIWFLLKTVNILYNLIQWLLFGRLLPPANEVCESYVFTPVCHSVHRGGGLPQCMLECTSPPNTRGRTPRDKRQTPSRPEADPPWNQCILGDTGNKRAVRILLECILVYRDYFWEIISEMLTSIAVPRSTKVALDSRFKIQQILFPLMFVTVSCTILYFRSNTLVTLFSLLLASDDTSTSWVISIVLFKIIQDRF